MSQSAILLRTARFVTLEGFMRLANDIDGVNVRALEPMTSLVVRTKNSTYHINAQGGTAAIVQGGRFFPSPTNAEVCGATMGGSLIKLGWIGVGLCLEIMVDGQRIITTGVRRISVHRAPGGSRPH